MEHRAVRDRIARSGSIRFDEYMDLALYAPGDGFFAAGGGAGRVGADFLTSPEVGPLFGMLVAEFLDRRWEALGCPDPYVVVEAAAGRGALAMSVLAASPRCRGALRYVLVERSEALRQRQREHLAIGHPFEVLGPSPDVEDPWAPVPGRGIGPLLCSLEDLPAEPFDGVVLANELLDNIPFRLLERQVGGWHEIRVTRMGDDLIELTVPADGPASEHADRVAPGALPGARIALQVGAAEWLRRALGVCRRGSVLVIDYTTATPSMAGRPQGEWLRTYHAHDRGAPPLVAPGAQDITVEVAVDQLYAVRPWSRRAAQADWLAGHGLGDLVEEGRRIWAAHAAQPGIDAMRARSRVVEADALVDPTGLGAFEVLEWELG